MSQLSEEIWKDINSGTDDTDIFESPKEFFNPVRIVLLNDLAHFGEASFSELKDRLKIPDGSLSSHIRSLVKKNIIVAIKDVDNNNKRLTRYILTKEGFDLFFKFVNNIQELFKWKKHQNYTHNSS